MQWAERIIADEAFELKLWDELAALNRKHRRGFVVRLHILGDFYSVDYARIWGAALVHYDALRVFGYTAHSPNSAIGAEILGLATEQWDRFAVRFSNGRMPTHSAEVVDTAGETETRICPAQTGGSDCCATCTLCWASQANIAFLRH